MNSNQECGIMKNLDIEEIEFMDTGSEDSCVEAYSTINKAMLKNRGYVEFVENNGSQKSPSYSYIHSNNILSKKSDFIEAVNKEIPGIDYIEQGACILSNLNEFDLKTPMNEEPKIPFGGKVIEQLVDEIEEDSLVIVTNTTTEDSDALTVVTSPMDSSPPRLPTSDLPSTTPPKSSSSELNRTLSDFDKIPTIPLNIPSSDDLNYEEYVRQLQSKIREISSARDSLDVKKAKRKSSKGDLTVEIQPISKPVTPTSPEKKSLSIFMQPTLTQKIDVIAKERTKQKDLIHDLVMDKLQSKKLLNAEKRLNRSRNRSSALSPNTSPYTPKTSPIVKLPLDERRHSVHATSPVKTPSELKFFKNLNDSRNISDSTPKILKTQSFCVHPSRTILNDDVFKTPVAPQRNNKNELTNTEKIRSEAKARARLKSNEDLGLSPEEKIKLLRKRFHLDCLAAGDFNSDNLNKSDDMKSREKKLMTSKSVSDIRSGNQISDTTDCLHKQTKSTDFTSDSHLNDSKMFEKRSRARSKDPERRKSIIQTVSDFFHKKKDSKDVSPAKEKSDGVFGIFRISPKSKSKVGRFFRFFGLVFYFYFFF